MKSHVLIKVIYHTRVSSIVPFEPILIGCCCTWCNVTDTVDSAYNRLTGGNVWVIRVLMVLNTGRYAVIQCIAPVI